MKIIAMELRDMAGDEVFEHKVGDWLSPVIIKNHIQKRFLAVARYTVKEK